MKIGFSTASFGLYVLLVFLSGGVQAQEKLVVGYTNLRSAKIPVPVGKEAGIFSRHGLDLKLVRARPGRTAIPKLIAGKIDIFLGNGFPTVQAVVKKNAKVAIIASLGETSMHLVARSGIRTAKDLKGKRIGVSRPGSSADRIARATLRTLGLDPDRDVEIVATGVSNSRGRLELVLENFIDAAIVSTPTLLTLGKKKEKISTIANLEDLGLFVSGADISVKRDFIKQRRGTLKRVLTALLESIAKTKEDQEITRLAYRKYGKIKNPDSLKWLVNKYVPAKIPSVPYPSRKAISSYLKESGASGLDMKAVADPTLLKEITASSR
ncbi:MAG: ABC transporter substrate-binding protein [Candidatus Binatia bacterium]